MPQCSVLLFVTITTGTPPSLKLLLLKILPFLNQSIKGCGLLAAVQVKLTLPLDVMYLFIGDLIISGCSVEMQ